MSAVLVQASGKLTRDNVSSPITLNATSNFTAGSTVIFPITIFGGPITSVSIAGAAATRAASATGNTNSPEIWYVSSVTGGRSDVVVTVTAGTGLYLSASIDEWTGLVTSSPVDISTSNTGNNINPTVTSGTLAQAAELVYAVMVPTGGVIDVTVAPLTPWVTSFLEGDGDAHEPGGASYQITAATTSVTATWTLTTAQIWLSTLASFKIAAGGGPTSNSLFFGSGA